ncbi:MAG: hypothetical protein RIC15_11310 [Vicingaceae bacterium]
MEEVLEKLGEDELLRPVLDKVELRLPVVNTDIYLNLLKTIVEQQLSTRAAEAIWSRFLDHFSPYPYPDTVLATGKEDLRGLGLSYQKAGYIRNIAEFTMHQDLSFDYVNRLDDARAAEHLVQIKGVGNWTAQMILMFSLGRTDVFPMDDLIIRNAMIQLYKVESQKKQLYLELEAIAGHWRPYRSYACYVLWDWYEVHVLGRSLYGA